MTISGKFEKIDTIIIVAKNAIQRWGKYMDFSYAQGSTKYRQLLRNDVVVIFLDTELVIRHVSVNNDILGVPAGMFSQNLPVRKFMPEDAFAALKAFSAGTGAECVIEYEFISDSVRVPIRHSFYTADNGFDDAVAIRSYVTLAGRGDDADQAVAEYETSLKYIGLINTLSIGIFSHDGHKFNYVNRMLGELLGCGAEELLGEPVSKYFDCSNTGDRLCGVNRFSTTATRKDGSNFPVNIGVQVEEAGVSYFATVEDATNYRSREQADGIFRQVFEHISEGVMLLDAAKTVTWTNPALTELTGYTAAAVAGKGVSMFYSDEHRPDFYESIWTLAGERVYKGIVWLRALNGNVPVTAVITAIKNENAEVLTYILMLSHAPDTIRLTEQAKNPNEDELTGFYSREYFESRLEPKLADCRESNGMCAVLLFDIDRFKTINEMYGVACADMLLKQIASRFRKFLPPGTMTGRGDDEFIALIEDPAALEQMDNFAERLLETMSRPFYIESMEIDVYISIAIVFYSDETSTKEAMLKSLASSLSLPKLDWKSSYHIHKRTAGGDRQTTLEEKLRAAIIKNEFELYYLAKVDTRTQKLTGLEALLRWQSPEMGLVSPAVFVPVAEGAGLMPALGELVFSMACQQLQKWNRKGFGDLRLAVNVSSLQLRDENLGEKFINIMSSYGIDPGRIELELTESFAFQERSITSRILGTLVDAGVTIALDDFGTGYSSISLLKKYPISILKIDRMFIKMLPDDPDNRELVSAMIAMAHSLGMKAVAEGVETLAQFEYMLDSGCDEMQGFFIGIPSPLEATEELIRSYAQM